MDSTDHKGVNSVCIGNLVRFTVVGPKMRDDPVFHVRYQQTAPTTIVGRATHPYHTFILALLHENPFWRALSFRRPAGGYRHVSDLTWALHSDQLLLV